MIEVLEGVPGSGKSYYAVTEKFLPWLRQKRRVYIYVEGIYLDRLAHFEGQTVENLAKQITVWRTVEEVRVGLLACDPGSAILIDESQTVFRSKEKVSAEILRMLETHRHRGLDIVMMCQQYGQMTLGVIRLVEVTTKFRRLDRFGLKNRYQAHVRGNPEETEVIRMFSGKYHPKNYSYYSSYSVAAIRETRRTGSIMRSPMIILGMVGLLGAGAWFSQGQWLTPQQDVKAQQAKKAEPVKLPPPPGLPVESLAVLLPAIEAPAVQPIRVQGGILTEWNGITQWVYVTEKGRMMTSDEIAQESGGIVNARMVLGIRELNGSGVIWGGQDTVEFYPPQARASVMPVPSHAERVLDASSFGSGSPSPGGDPFATPPGILATPREGTN